MMPPIVLLSFIGFFIAIPRGFCEPSEVLFEKDASATSKTLDFNEGSIVSDLDENPFSSLTNTALQTNSDSTHLYILKPHYHLEIQSAIIKAGFLP
jgi:hypothetical protein